MKMYLELLALLSLTTLARRANSACRGLKEHLDLCDGSQFFCNRAIDEIVFISEVIWNDDPAED
jgi:hypothetical protein